MLRREIGDKDLKILNVLRLPIHRLKCARSLDILREFKISELLNCFLPLVEAGNTKEDLSATRSFTGKPLSENITSPGNPISCIICLSEVLPPYSFETNDTLT
ncbi:hypothetical protein TNCT_163621 [Trichonephila clavata]|uniref:Uncharacterized protein n=1 Tax=Trichonephila clavata TaxID=2740835 RepID=A0A8X6K5W8_TRICU|nr:hypothetical protein TNCT_163621 [Trichonephila clavata]